MSKRKTPSGNNIKDDERKAELEIQAAVEAAKKAPAGQTIRGLGPSPAALFLQIRPSHQSAQYDTSLRPGEKSLLLTYYAIQGDGEALRLLLAEVGASYDHIAVLKGEDQSVASEWRSRSPNGLLPMITGLGVPRSSPLSQSGSVLRYLARRFGLNGRTELEAAAADVLYEMAKDMSWHVDKISARNPERDMSAKLPFFAALRVEKILRGMADPSDDDKALNYGQIQLLYLLRRCEARRGGCVRENLGVALDEFRVAMVKRPGIAAYLASPGCFPFTKGELGREGGYDYVSGPISRGDIQITKS